MPYTSTQNGVAIVGCAATGPLAFVINVWFIAITQLYDNIPEILLVDIGGILKDPVVVSWREQLWQTVMWLFPIPCEILCR
jgi:hypothetical protein